MKIDKLLNLIHFIPARYLDQLRSQLLGVVYVVDSANLSKQVRDAAEFLFNILSDPVVNANATALTVACNKQVHRIME